MTCRIPLSAVALTTFCIALSNAAFPRGQWPNGPNKAWFQNLQRPDNNLHPVLLRDQIIRQEIVIVTLR